MLHEPGSTAAHTELVKAILFALGGMPDVFVEQVNVVGAHRGDRYVQSVDEGHPDILACVNGLFVALEAKTGGGKLSKEQRSFRTGILRGHGRHHVVRSVDDALRAIEEARHA